MKTERPRVLVVVDYYWPGERAGGPVRSVMNLVVHLADEVEFFIATKDRDLGDRCPYLGIAPDRWVAVGDAQVQYMSPLNRVTGGATRLARGLAHEVLYINSYFSRSSVQLLAARRARLLRGMRLVVAPRGQFGTAALDLKRGKKSTYLSLANAGGFHRDITWHATNEDEAERITEATRPRQRVVVAPNLPVRPALGDQPDRLSDKTPGTLRIAMVARVSRMKNIVVAVQLLADLPGRIEFDVFGPHEDERYLNECQREAQRLGPGVTVRFPGAIPQADVARTLGSYHLFLLPTLGENFGHAIHEALAAGCPVLVSDRTPWRGLEASGAGWDISLDARDRFREVLLICLLWDGLEHARMSRAARAFAVNAAIVGEGDTRAAYRKLFGMDA